MGNLLNRVTTKKLTKKLESPELMYTLPEKLEEEDAKLFALLEELPRAPLFSFFQRRRPSDLSSVSLAGLFDQNLTAFEIHRALAAVFDALAEANRHVQQISPWLATASPSAVHRALFFGSESLRIAAILLQPFMPDKADQLLEMLGVPAERRTWTHCGVGQGGVRTACTPGKAHLWPSIVPNDVSPQT